MLIFLLAHQGSINFSIKGPHYKFWQGLKSGEINLHLKCKWIHQRWNLDAWINFTLSKTTFRRTGGGGGNSNLFSNCKPPKLAHMVLHSLSPPSSGPDGGRQIRTQTKVWLQKQNAKNSKGCKLWGEKQTTPGSRTGFLLPSRLLVVASSLFVPGGGACPMWFS